MESNNTQNEITLKEPNPNSELNNLPKEQNQALSEDLLEKQEVVLINKRFKVLLAAKNIFLN